MEGSSIRFMGVEVEVEEDAVWGGGFGDGTGWRVWNSTAVVLRWLSARCCAPPPRRPAPAAPLPDESCPRCKELGGAAAGAHAPGEGSPGRVDAAAAAAAACGARARLGAALACFPARGGGSGPAEPALGAPDAAGCAVTTTRVLDISAGTGALGIALAAAGCDAVLSDTEAQLDTLRENVRLNAGALARSCAGPRGSRCEPGAVTLMPLRWGDDAALRAVVQEGQRLRRARNPAAGGEGGDGGGGGDSGDGGGLPFTTAVAADLLFCAVRDGLLAALAETLAATLRHAAPHVLFAWEERCTVEEAAFIRSLHEEHGIAVRHVPLDGVAVDDLVKAGSEGVAGAGGAGEAEAPSCADGASPSSRFHLVWMRMCRDSACEAHAT